MHDNVENVMLGNLQAFHSGGRVVFIDDFICKIS